MAIFFSGVFLPIIFDPYDWNAIYLPSGPPLHRMDASDPDYHGWNGSDYVLGSDVADVISTVGGDDHVDAGSGDDFVFAGADNDTVHGRAGNDTLYGEGGVDFLYGGTGNDTLYGGDHRDYLYGGSGDDILIGGAWGDYLNGGFGSDTASYETAWAGVRVEMMAPGDNTGDAAGDEYVSIENLRGSYFDDWLEGDGAMNFIDGLGGDDYLFGWGGNDVLRGGRGTDRLVGGEGDDILVGGPGSDFYLGGLGLDFAVFEGARAEWTRRDIAGDPTYGTHTQYTRTLAGGSVETERLYTGFTGVERVQFSDGLVDFL